MNNATNEPSRDPMSPLSGYDPSKYDVKVAKFADSSLLSKLYAGQSIKLVPKESQDSSAIGQIKRFIGVLSDKLLYHEGAAAKKALQDLHQFTSKLSLTSNYKQLEKLKDEGKITEAQYKRLYVEMGKDPISKSISKTQAIFRDLTSAVAEAAKKTGYKLETKDLPDEQKEDAMGIHTIKHREGVIIHRDREGREVKEFMFAKDDKGQPILVKEKDYQDMDAHVRKLESDLHGALGKMSVNDDMKKFESLYSSSHSNKAITADIRAKMKSFLESKANAPISDAHIKALNKQGQVLTLKRQATEARNKAYELNAQAKDEPKDKAKELKAQAKILKESAQVLEAQAEALDAAVKETTPGFFSKDYKDASSFLKDLQSGRGDEVDEKIARTLADLDPDVATQLTNMRDRIQNPEMAKSMDKLKDRTPLTEEGEHELLEALKSNQTLATEFTESMHELSREKKGTNTDFQKQIVRGLNGVAEFYKCQPIMDFCKAEMKDLATPGKIDENKKKQTEYENQIKELKVRGDRVNEMRSNADAAIKKRDSLPGPSADAEDADFQKHQKTLDTLTEVASDLISQADKEEVEINKELENANKELAKLKQEEIKLKKSKLS